ncbi:MAG TPA: hypothetical protein PKY73_16665, partial [Hyphomonas sp.]|nr:hypothetical protein [Hyphomonas sp.]
MNDLLKQISSYNLFNYLLPGATFCWLADQATAAQVAIESIFLAFFFYYFVGMIVSRVGSLVLEPMLKRLGFIKFDPYKDYIKASKLDSKIEMLSESNNTFRSLMSVGVCLIIYVVGYNIAQRMELSTSDRYVVLAIVIVALFAFSYRKQTDFIRKRISANLSP